MNKTIYLFVGFGISTLGWGQKFQYGIDAAGNRISKTYITVLTQTALLKNDTDSTIVAEIKKSDATVSVQQPKTTIEERSIEVLPILAQSSITVETKGFDSIEKEIHLYDLSGHLILNHSFFENNANLNISTFADGQYIVLVVAGDYKKALKIQKN